MTEKLNLLEVVGGEYPDGDCRAPGYNYNVLVFDGSDDYGEPVFVARVEGVREEDIHVDVPCLVAVIGDVVVATCREVFENLGVEPTETTVAFAHAVGVYNFVENVTDCGGDE